jgi:hypothetical protein
MKSIEDWLKITCICADPSIMEVSGQTCDDCGYLLPQTRMVN